MELLIASATGLLTATGIYLMLSFRTVPMIPSRGMFLRPIGAVMLTFASLSRLALRAGETVSPTPFDIDPGKAAK